MNPLPIMQHRGYEPNVPVQYAGLACMQCGIQGRIPGSANCVTRVTEAGEMLVLCAQCYHIMAMQGPMQRPMSYPGIPSAAAVDTTFRVGRALGSAVGTVMGNVAALGVGATMGVASSVSQVASHALRRNPSLSLPELALRQSFPMLDEQAYHTPTAAHPPAEMPNGGSESAASASRTANPSSVSQGAIRESTASASHSAAPAEEPLELKEEPTSEEAQREGTPRARWRRI